MDILKNYCILQEILKYLNTIDSINLLIAINVLENLEKYVVKRRLFGSQMKSYRLKQLSAIELSEENAHHIDWFKLTKSRRLLKNEIAKFILFIPLKQLEIHYNRMEMENFREIQHIIATKYLRHKLYKT